MTTGGKTTLAMLPAELAAFAQHVLGPLTAPVDLSWPYQGSEVYRITDAHAVEHIVKRLENDRFYAMEVEGYRWAPVLGSGRAPRLEAADPDLRVVITSFLPGHVLTGVELDPEDERDAYRQAGELLALLHRAEEPSADTAVVDRLIGRSEQQLRKAERELTRAQREVARGAARTLAELGPRLPSVPSHGDFQPRNLLYDRKRGQVAAIDFERAAFAPAVRDLVRLESGVFAHRPRARAGFYRGYGRELESLERQALIAWMIVDAVSGLAWGIPNGDAEVVARARNVFTRPELADLTAGSA